MKRTDSFFERKEQSEFIQRVYGLAPARVRGLIEQEDQHLRQALSGTVCVLEVGCGYGRALTAVPVECEYAGVDVAFSYLAEARHRYPDRDWLCANAVRLPFAHSTFDSVFCIQNTLGNMIGIETEVVRESFRVCRRPGKVIVGVYSEDSFDIRGEWYDRLIEARIFGRVWLDPHSPRIARSDTGWSSRCFDRNDLEQLFQREAANLDITKIDSFSYFCVAEPAEKRESGAGGCVKTRK